MRLIKKILGLCIFIFFICLLTYNNPTWTNFKTKVIDPFWNNTGLKEEVQSGAEDVINRAKDLVSSGEYQRTLRAVKDTTVSGVKYVIEYVKAETQKNHSDTAISFDHYGNQVTIPAYSGNPYVELNDNKAFFNVDDFSKETFEQYGELDSLGRVTYAIANVSKDTKPTEERGDISSIYPTGWVQKKYPSLIEDEYLYNRCHMIAYSLTGENANERNLMTGTRFMNLAMTLYEQRINAYIGFTDNHVIYRATPVFIGNNLLAHGIVLEAKSIENNDINFCVYIYNVQPNISINYQTGDSELIH